MTGPGEAMAQMAYTARKALKDLSQKEMIEYKKAVEIIASKYNNVDERLSGFNAQGKLSIIEQILKEK